MKKIVAVVLALVMVLGLSTVAFAAKMGTDLEAAKADAGWDYVVEVDDEEDAKDETFATYEIEAVAKKDMEDATLLGEAVGDVEKGDDFSIDGIFVKVGNAELADLVLIDGKVITYFMEIEDELTWETKATKTTLAAFPVDDADKACNTLYSGSERVPVDVYAYDDVLWVADEDGEVVFNVGGVAVFVREAEYGYGEDVINTGHDYEIKTKGDHDTGAITEVYCQACKKEFKFVEAPETDAISVFGAGNYQPLVDDQGTVLAWMELVDPANWPGAGAGVSAGSSDAAGDKVESAETFDAGIAMYVGMSVMAAAGSAVVLKKKD